MTAARTNAPTLAWLLTALTCLLVGLAVGEYRHQAVSLPVVPSRRRGRERGGRRPVSHASTESRPADT